jgi:hydroxymethylglutaryl-CoA lyase
LDIEVGAFVREDKIPQMANSGEILKILNKEYFNQKNKSPRFWALVPNEKGLERAIECGARYIAVFTGSTNTFTQKNIGMSVDESLRVFEKITDRAEKEKIKVRGYLSTVWGCPYEGKVNLKKPLNIAKSLLSLGCMQVSLGDTIGVATPIEIISLLRQMSKEIKNDKIAGHFHDTRGTALANCFAALECGVKTLDSSSAGLGGCNYAPGASGNVASEDLIYMLNGMKIKTNISLDNLCEASSIAIQSLNRLSTSKYYQSWRSKKLIAS